MVSLTGGSITDWTYSRRYPSYLKLYIGSGSITFYDALSIKVNDFIINPMPTESISGDDKIVNFYSDVVINGYAGNDGIENSGKNVLINTGTCTSGDYSRDYVYNYGDNATISTEGNSWIENYASAKIHGGAGNDYIWNRSSQVTQGSAGSDVFIYSGGNDIIADYAVEDKISVAGTVNVTTSGNNVILTVGSGKITVKNAYNKVVTYIDLTGTNYYPKNPDPVILSGNGVTLRANYTNETFDSADYSSNIATIDASAVTHNLKIMAVKPMIFSAATKMIQSTATRAAVAMINFSARQGNKLQAVSLSSKLNKARSLKLSKGGAGNIGRG